MISIANALKVEGWMNPEDLEWLARQARGRNSIVEVGCWMGRSTIALVENTRGYVVAVDHWRGSEEHQSGLQQKHEDWLFQQFLHNMGGYSIDLVRPLRMSSLGAAQYLSSISVSFDMVFIDASHDYESVKADILAWKPLVRGLLCGRDSGHPPVERAVKELLPDARFEQSFWAVELP